MVILFDTDIGLGTPRAELDDGAAIVFLLRALGEKVAGVTAVHGNASLESAMHNSRRLLSYLERTDIPLGRGAASGLVEQKEWFADWEAGYGDTPPWPPAQDEPLAANLIIDTIRAHPGEVVILAVGPLTNLALAARLAPDIVGKVRQIVCMGGSFGQEDPQPEFNARCDPEAAQAVLNAGWPIQLIGLNITTQLIFTYSDFASLPDSNPALTLLKDQAPGWIARVEGAGWEEGGCALHDALAVAAVMDPSLFSWQQTAVTVELCDPQRRGATYLRETADGKVAVATAVDAVRCRELIWQYLAA